jgi:predicted DNA-binding protein
MPRPSGRQLGLYVPVETAERLRALSERTMIPQSRLLRRALELLFAEYERPKKAKKAAQQKGAAEN